LAADLRSNSSVETPKQYPTKLGKDAKLTSHSFTALHYSFLLLRPRATLPRGMGRDPKQYVFALGAPLQQLACCK
ncbi:hypothetical protein LLEC1_00670, partial [Akanthomyces lecanii]